MLKRELNFEDSSPLLYLIASPIGNLDEFSSRAKKTIEEMDFIASEDTRNTGKLLSLFSIKKPLISCHEHNEEEASEKIVSLLKEGRKVAYLSDAGYPAISDPGARLTKKCLENGIKVSVINGPNAAIMALVASGLDTSHFYFYGFLESKESARKKELLSLKDFQDTMIFYEAPHRIQKTLTNMAEIFGEERHVSLARELTKKHEEFIRGTLKEVLAVSGSLLGEMVLVVEGKKEEKKEPTEGELLLALKESLKEKPSKEAIKDVAKRLHAQKSVVYDLYLENFKE